MKLKKFFKPLVTVSALSFMLMGCADDSSNSGGSTTPPPTAQSVFTKFLTDFQTAPAKNAEKPVEFTTNTATKPSLTVAKGEEVQYLVSLDNVMAVYYAMFRIEGTSTLLTEAAGADAISGVTKITNYAKVDTASATTDVPLTLANGTNSLYTGMFALMTEQEVKDLDTALGKLDKEIEESKPTAGEVTTPDLTKIQAATVQKVVDLINGNMYKVAYNSPAQSIQDAFAAAKPLTLKNGMAFNEGTSATTFEIAAGFSFAESDPVVGATSVVVFLDNFENLLNGMDTANAAKDVVKGKGTLTNAGNLGITTETLSNSATQNKITYTPADTVVAGAKVTYVAILDATTDIDSGTDNAPFKVLNGKIATGATKAEVDAALALISDKIYKIDYTVGTKLELVNNFKQTVADAVAGTEGATLQVTNLTLALNASNYEDTTTTTAANTENIYCFDGLFAGVDTTYTKYLQLNSVNGGNAQDVSTDTGVYKATSGDPSSTNKIDFTTQGSPASTDVIKAYCSKAFTSDDSTTFESLVTTYNTTKNYDNLKALIDGLVAKGVIYGEVTVQ